MITTQHDRVLDRVRQEQLAHPAPVAWQARLAQISPRLEAVSFLRFAWDAWAHVFTIWEMIPWQVTDPERAHQLTEHWSALPKERQQGRKAMVWDFAFYSWHTERLDARRFWICQGLDHPEWGGNPANYTDREQSILRATGQPHKAPPAGAFPYQPFDERTVRGILARDRLLRYQGNLKHGPSAGDVLNESEQAYRQAFLGWFKEEMKPKSDFLAWWMQESHRAGELRDGTRKEANLADQWEDAYLATGVVPAAV